MYQYCKEVNNNGYQFVLFKVFVYFQYLQRYLYIFVCYKFVDFVKFFCEFEKFYYRYILRFINFVFVGWYNFVYCVLQEVIMEILRGLCCVNFYKVCQDILFFYILLI